MTSQMTLIDVGLPQRKWIGRLKTVKRNGVRYDNVTERLCR